MKIPNILEKTRRHRKTAKKNNR